MVNLGADEALMRRAIDELPPEVSLAFLAGTPDLPRWLRRRRERGHEGYLMLPVEDPAGRPSAASGRSRPLPSRPRICAACARPCRAARAVSASSFPARCWSRSPT
jgi:polysaccharide deacetylase 2 family uncharacterized protein YibQ